MDQQSPQTPTGTRPRATSRAFSHRSDKSSASKPKADQLNESPADKKRRDSFWKGGSKANPNAAINEAQPGDAAFSEKATLESLRGSTHKDVYGNIIADPDLCNPTRSRWERPLDTIRSFERAIDGDYKRRSSSRTEPRDQREQYQSRRSSSYFAGGYDNSSARYNGGSNVGTPGRLSQYNGGYYGPHRQDNLYDDGTSPMAPPSRNRFNQRVGGPASRSNSQYGMYPQQQQQPYESYEAGMTSDSTGPWNNSTDPSSENSSIDRAQVGGMKPHTPQPAEGYGEYNYGNPIAEEYASDSDGYGYPTGPSGMRKNLNNGGPVVPHQSQAPAVRAPIKLGGSDSNPLAAQGGSLPSTARKAPEKEEKKKGFFKKRFSKA